MRVDASEDWWSEWLELPEKRFTVQARVILGDGVEALVDEGMPWRRPG